MTQENPQQAQEQMTEKRDPQQRYRKVDELKFQTYEEAKKYFDAVDGTAIKPLNRIRIRRRRRAGSFDVVHYQLLPELQEKPKQPEKKEQPRKGGKRAA